jgi:hypothetical protein
VTWLAAKLAVDHGYAANMAGGSHHALSDTGAGYCVFNEHGGKRTWNLFVTGKRGSA